MRHSKTLTRMDLSSYSVPISMLRQYCFCPRIPFFNEIRGLNPADRPWMKQGLTYHQKQAMLNKRRKLQRYGVSEGKLEHNVRLKGCALPMHGIADAILVNGNEVCPIEFKLEAVQIRRGQIMQLMAYGILAEEYYGIPFRRGFILYGHRGKTAEVVATNARRKEVENIVEALLAIFGTQLMPESSASASQCGQCEYLNFCADRETTTGV